MKTNETQAMYEDLFSPCMIKMSHMLIERGDGPYVYLQSGEKYLDLVQGVAVNNLGHCHPEVVEAACDQMKKIIHGSLFLANYPSIMEFAATLKDALPEGLDMFFFSNTGTESVEGALKLARFTTKRSGTIALRGSYHGRSMGAASLTTSTVLFRKNYAPFLPQVYFAPFPYCYRCSFGKEEKTCELECLNYLKEDFKHIIPKEDISALIFEPIQGEGGYIVPPVKYVKALRELCNEQGLLLICDEVQTGVGRTGKMLAVEHFGITPDIVTMGKAVGGGFQLGVVAASKELMQKWTPGTHGTTFGGHPVAAAAGVVTLNIINNDDFLEDVTKKGKYFRSRLRSLAETYPEIGDVRGLGLMNAIEFVKDGKEPDTEKAMAVRDYFFEQNILILPCGVNKNVLRFIPPLNISLDLLDRVIQTLKNGLAFLKP